MNTTEIIKYLNSHDFEESRFFLKSRREKFKNIRFINALFKGVIDKRKVYQSIIDNVFYIKNLSCKVIKSIYFKNVFEYAIKTKQAYIFSNQGQTINKHQDIDEIVEMLGFANINALHCNSSISIHIVNKALFNNYISEREMFIETIKYSANKEIEYLNKVANTETWLNKTKDNWHKFINNPQKFLNIKNDYFMEHFDLKDFKNNSKCLLMFLIKPNLFTEEQKENIVSYLQDSLLNAKLDINKMPFDFVDNDIYKSIQSSILIRKLQ